MYKIQKSKSTQFKIRFYSSTIFDFSFFRKSFKKIDFDRYASRVRIYRDNRKIISTAITEI